MSKAAEHHRQASTHYHDAARHHQEAAHFSQAGNHEKAAYHAAFAAEHQRRASQHADEAAKHRPSASAKAILFVALCLGLMSPQFMTAAETSGSRELLTQYVIELQTAPEDQALRERIIKLERTLTPSLAVPADANRFFVKATIFQQEATDIQASDPLSTSARDFAIFYYKEALLIAPWWPEAYDGLSRSLEASGRLNEAVAALKLYIVTRPNSAGASAAEDRLCAIAAKRDKGAAKP
jgi:tetratricopeptide (TPR) repeat protein